MRFSHLAVMGLVGVFSLTGCVFFPQEQLYQLQPTTATELPRSGTGVEVLLGPFKLADYLQRETLVQRQGDGTLVVNDKARWAGDLQKDMAQLILRQLASDLDSSRLVLYPDDTGFKPELQITLEISRLDSGPEQPAVLEAQWRLLDSRGEMQNGRILHLRQNHDGSLSDQVHAQGLLLQQLSDQIASSTRPLVARLEAEKARAARAAKEQAALAATRKKEKEKIFKLPASVPIRTDMEVFRF
ncbi:PqiC family protein [Azomonas macrocytogenes]|uniref:ABC-type transport auxiliary lipoprotein component domain-containing protein n=1 Tax=Azomonas macrocytogenes TaxID=69962 RepID=A0A839T022_AZOMA|nr:PqiC family protein [Azomonas macrocytogenes]MBB3102488.1 hypothetical protein [Azomonas macrocytogenes]